MKHLKCIRTLLSVVTYIIGFASFLHAQSDDSISIAQHLRYKLSLLDKTKAYTGYIYDQTPVSIAPTLHMGIDVDSLRPDVLYIRSLIRQHYA